MEDVIDLRPYIQLLLAKIIWIAGAALALGGLVFLILTNTRDSYEATAVVVLVNETDIVQFEPSILPAANTSPLNALPALATSDEIVTRLRAATAVSLPHERLRRRLNAESAPDRSVVLLTVRMNSPQSAMEVANEWARIFTDHVNSSFGFGNENQVVFFENALATATDSLAQAEADLIAFQETNLMTVISDTLHINSVSRQMLLEEIVLNIGLQADADNLLAELERVPGNGDLPFADQLTALVIQLEAQTGGLENRPVLMESASVTLIGANRSEQLAYLRRLQATLTQKQAHNTARLAELEGEQLQLQRDYQAALASERQLMRQITLAENLYLSLSRKVEEERINTQDNQSGLRVFSMAALPAEPTGRRTTLYAGLAALTGALTSALVILVRHWWRQDGA